VVEHSLGKGEVDSSILSGSTMSVWPPTPPRTRMTPQQVNLIKSSFATIFFTRDESAKLFYDRLFTVAPRLRPLFKSDMES
jgi:Globin